MNLDRTFCISPNCKNECGRKFTDEIRKAANKNHRPVSTAYLCDPPDWRGWTYKKEKNV